MKRPAKEASGSNRRIGRRALILGALQLNVAGVLGLRMRHLQIEEADQFRLLAEENRINMRLLPPARGKILDRAGVVLAGNGQNYRVVIVREDAGDVEEVLARLRRLVWIDPDDLERARREIARRSPFVPVTVAERLSWEEISRVAVNAPALPGITPEVGLSREYPMGPDFAHITGYVGPVSDYDLSKLKDPDPLLQIPRFQIGKTGIEYEREADLRGRAGAKRIEVNAAGRVMREIGRQPSTSGEDLRLTIDAGLQHFVQVRLAGESAGVVVMDPRDGDLLAMGSAPSYDPNLFVRGISVADYGALNEDPYRPLATKTVQGAYPPGSCFKMVVALAALEEGVAAPGDTVYCPGHMQLGNRRFHCWKRGGHGYVDLNESLEQSCDVYYYEMAQRVGVDLIAEYARRLGLGQAFSIPLRAVREGIVPDKAWKMASYGQGWRIGDSLNTAIGQGYVLTTPLQLAVMTARLATGRAVLPRLIRAVGAREEPLPEAPPLGVRAENLARVQRGMHDVVNGGRGTAGRSRILGDDQMAGKTGTSQVRNITAAERAAGVTRNEDLPWNRRDHGLFVAYAPVEAPRVAVSVIVEHGGGGSTAAAPIARDVVLYALHGGVPPIEAYPPDQRERIRTMWAELPLRALGAPAADPRPSGDRA